MVEDNNEFDELEDTRQRDSNIRRMLEQQRAREATRPSSSANLYVDSNVDHQSNLYIPPHLIPDDRIYFWGRETCLEKTDSTRINSLMRQGFTPVPAERHPELVPLAVFAKTNGDTFIRSGGLMLLEIEKAMFFNLISASQAQTDQIEDNVADYETQGWSPLRERQLRKQNRSMGISDYGHSL